jgi:hypothetical protein
MSKLAFAAAAVTLVADILFILMYIFEVPTDGPYAYGRANNVFSAISGLMIALLILGVSSKAEDSPGSRLFVRVAVAATVVGAIASVLGMLGLLPFWISATVFIVVLLLQAAWMIWVNTRLYENGVFSRILSRCGQIVGYGLLLGMLIVAVSLLLPWLTVPELLVLGFGIFVGGGVWLAWPVWFVLLGVQLLRRPGAAPAPAPGTRAVRSTRRGRRAAGTA